MHIAPPSSLWLAKTEECLLFEGENAI